MVVRLDWYIYTWRHKKLKSSQIERHADEKEAEDYVKPAMSK
jgi:hypothetical protein